MHYSSILSDSVIIRIIMAVLELTFFVEKWTLPRSWELLNSRNLAALWHVHSMHETLSEPV